MELDDLFDRDDRRRAGRRYRRRDDDHDRDRDDRDHRRRWRDHDDDDDDDRYRRRSRSAGSPWSRRAHPHLFSWVLLGGGAVLFGLALIAILSSLGLWGAIADGYFAVTTAVLPASWHDEWRALPDLAHVALGLGALFVAAGVAGEVLD